MTWRDHLKIHPACDLLPAMAPEELRALSNDIRTNGLQDRAKLIPEGDGYEMIDGRSRMDALEMIGPIQVFTGTVPNNKFFEVIDLEGRDPFTLVLSLNVHRRHLTAEQKRELIAKVLTARPELSDRAIASTTKVSDKTVGAVRRKLEGGAEIPHHQPRIGKDGVIQTHGRWPRVRKTNPTETGTGRKTRPPAIDAEPELPMMSHEAPVSPEPMVSTPEVKPQPALSNQPVEVAPPPDPIRLHVVNVIGAVAALNRLPEDVDFDRMASIVDPNERPHLRARVSRGLDVLQSVWLALGEAIEPPALAEQDPSSDIIDDLPSLEITEQMPPIP
jgi:hypothetical protein